jgi:gliding motility-associated-like protein
MCGLLTLLVALPLQAQSPTTKGREFWLGFMENLALASNGPPEFVILVSATTGARGTVSLPATDFSLDFEVAAGSTREVRLPAATWNPFGSGVTGNTGIRITTDAPVSVTAVHYRLYFTESTQVLPTTELADEYIVLAARDEIAENPSQLLIAATEDNTQITLTPSTFTVDLRPANRPYTITLNQGQVYQLQAATDLTGTLVKAAGGKKIALFAGARQANIFCGGDDSHIYDQNYPLSRWGRQYLAVPYAEQEGDLIKIVAAFDNTTVRFDCGEDTRRLNRGESFERVITTTTSIESDNLISVAQFMKSQSCNPLAGPNMLVLPPLSFQTKRATFQVLTGFGSSTVYRNYINVVTTTGATNRLRLDGRPFSATWRRVGSNPLYSFTQYPISQGSHVLSSDSSFYATSYGFDIADAYTHSLGYETDEFLQSPNVAVLNLGKDTTLCQGQSLVLNATTPGALRYRWQDGSAAASYTVTQPGTYQVEVSAGPCQAASGSIRVAYRELPLPQLGPDTTLCPGQQLLLDVSRAGTAFQWQDGTSGGNYLVSRPGRYRVTVSNGNCTASDEIEVGYEPALPGYASEEKRFGCGSEAVPLDASVGLANVSYRWQDGTTGAAFLAPGPGTYRVEIASRCGKVSRTFKVEPILPPNVFTPNGDGVNDCFEVPGIGAGGWNLWVYNRWGKLVYRQQGYNNAWCAEGEVNGVYYYQLTKPGGPPCPIKGWVQVLR